MKDIAAYVDATLAMQGLNPTAERRAEILRTFELLTEMARRVDAVALPTQSEPAPVYRP